MNIVQPTAPAGATSLVTNNAAPTPAAPIAAVSGTLLAAGLAVAQLAPGALLRAVVTGRNEAGQLMLELGKAKAALATQANLPAGSEVVLQVRSGGARPQVAILPVAADGHQAAARQGQAAAPAAPPPQAAGWLEPVEPALPQVVGLSTTAVVVAGPAAEAAADALPPPQPPSAPAGGLPPTPPLAAGTTLALRINAVVPPGEPIPPQFVPAAAPGTLQAGVVSALTAAGHPVVQTQAGLLLLAAKLAVPVGATVLVELRPEPEEAEAAAPPPGSGTRAGSDAAAPFPRLAQALDALRQAGLPAPADLPRHLPHTGPRLAEGLVAALAAAHGDDGPAGLERILRPALDRLGHGDIADALRQELAHAAAASAQSAQSDWRVHLLPILDEGRLHQLRIYERQQGGRQQGRGAAAGSRFVVEVEMSRLGAIQLDGLVQPRRFDLMVRSRGPLPEALRRDIAAIFAEARSAGGFAGEIGFQQTPVFPVNPKAAEGRGAGLVV